MVESLSKWRDFKELDEQVLSVLEDKLKFENVTKVQKAVIPLFMHNKDVCVKSSTGSGKTLAFTVPLIQQIRRIVTTPSR